MGLLTPTRTATLSSDHLLPFAVMAPRLQATLENDALDLSLWGSGDIARISLRHDWQGSFTYGANILTSRNGGIWVAQSLPAMLVHDARVARVTPAKKPAQWAQHNHAATRPDATTWQLPWGWLSITQHGNDIVIACGATADECQRAVRMNADTIIREAENHAAQCDLMPTAPPLLRSMVYAGMHTALASRRTLADGRFAGLAAGMNYTAPARTYYRDGHWTVQALLHADPASVRAQIDLLAKGIHSDGEAPSAVITADAALIKVWDNFRLSHPDETAAHRRAGEWWSDHTDSPLFFILTLADYCRATGDVSLFKTYATQVHAIFHRYAHMARSGDGLPVKPRHDRDWADNVFRSGHVSYIAGLWMCALRAVMQYDDVLRDAAAGLHVLAKRAVRHHLLTADGWPCDYRDTKRGVFEDHLTLDALPLIDGGAFGENETAALCAHIAATLETRNNTAQPHGDWGVMCAWPPYRTRADLRGKTVFAYRYHNGSDWPWLDGLYARTLLRNGIAGWKYPLLRWWEYGLARGWTSPVEYFSPPYGRGSLLQGWSSMPAAVALEYRDRF